MKNNKLVKVVIALVIVVVIGGLAVLGLGMISLSSSKVGIKDKSIAKKTDEFAGIFITYGTEKINPSQKRLNEKKKVYGKKNIEDGRLIFEGLEGVEYVYYKVIKGKKEDSCNMAFMGEELGGGKNSYAVKDMDTVNVDFESSIYLNPAIEKDIVCYVNPVYKDYKDELYVTSQNNKKIECSCYEFNMQLKSETGLTSVCPVEMSSDEMNIEKGCSKQIKVRIDIGFKNPTVELQVKALGTKDNLLDKKVYSGEELSNISLKKMPEAVTYIVEKKDLNNCVEKEIDDSVFVLVPAKDKLLLRKQYIWE